uniref:Uncharacterized protein n=1 Tax=Ciona intestinalis TaxID=7719 RepID=H2XQW3_CIOIN
MPVNVRRGYNSRATACGLVDPEVSWKMDHCLTPYTPSRPELFRHHYSRRRTKSAAPRLITTDPTMVNPRFPRVPLAYSVGASGKSSPRPPSRKQAQTVH